MLQQMQSRFVFRQRELQLVSSAGMRAPLTKKGEPNSSAPLLKNDGLEVELHNKLHGASIVGEGLCRIVEGTAVNPNETSDAGISD
jgi:hypothetical protein